MTELDKRFSKLRWTLGIRGIFAIVFGVIAFGWPGITLAILAGLYSAYAVVRGGISVIGALTHQSSGNARWLILGAGLASLAAGAAAYGPAEPTALRLMLVMAAAETVLGVTDIAFAFHLRNTIERVWLLVLAGCLSTALGILMFALPASEFLGMVWMIGWVSIMTGALLVALALHSGAWSCPGRRVAHYELEQSRTDEASAERLADRA